MGVQVSKLDEIREAAGRVHVASLDAPLEDGKSTLGSRYASGAESGENLSNRALDAVSNAALRKAIKDLPRQQREILWRRYFDPNPSTYRKLGDEFNLHPEIVRKLEHRALESLRDNSAVA